VKLEVKDERESNLVLSAKSNYSPTHISAQLCTKPLSAFQFSLRRDSLRV
jgi:hypothetical protein